MRDTFFITRTLTSVRVHGVQDNGYQHIAGMAQWVNKEYDGVKAAERIIDSLIAKKNARLTMLDGLM